jgi:hypothetical protein
MAFQMDIDFGSFKLKRSNCHLDNTIPFKICIMSSVVPNQEATLHTFTNKRDVQISNDTALQFLHTSVRVIELGISHQPAHGSKTDGVRIQVVFVNK